MNESLKKFLKPLASLRLTVVLLFLSMLLVYAGTSAQKEMGVWEVQHWYFHCFVCFIPLKYLLPLSDWWWQHAPDIHVRLPQALGGGVVNGVPFLGGYVLIGLLLANLLAAHTVRFKFTWKRSGILLIHSGLILLLVGEIFTSRLAVEGVMSLNNGQSQDYADDIRDYELAIVDPSPAAKDKVAVIAASRLQEQKPIHDARLPFDVRVDKYYPNSQVMGPQQVVNAGISARPEATAGQNAKLVLVKREAFTGVGEDSDKVNAPGAYVTFLGGGQSLGTYLLKVDSMINPFIWTGPQEVKFEGKTYLVQLRFKRVYKPYTIRLVKFTHQTYLGTDMASNFASRVQLLDTDNGVDREVVISMNHPLRYHNDTIYQQKFNMMVGGEEGTVLQVVTNPSWLMPYFAVAIGGLGLVIHFGLTLYNFLRRRMAAQSAPPPLPAGRGAAARGDKAGLQGGGGRRQVLPVESGESYSLHPSLPWKFLVTAGTVALALIVTGSFFASAMSVKATDSFNVDGFGKLPAWDEGRSLPLDSLARNSLKIIHGRQTFEAPVAGQADKTRTVSATQWLLDLWAKPEVAADYKVFRVDNDDVKGMLGVKEGEKFFSWNDLFRDPDNRGKLQKQAEQAGKVADKDQDAYQSKVVELYRHATTYLRLSRGGDYAQLYELRAHQDQAQDFLNKGAALEDADPKTLNGDQQRLLDRYQSIANTLRELQVPQQIREGKMRLPAGTDAQEEGRLADQQRQRFDLYAIVPPEPGKDWVGMGQSILDYYSGSADAVAPTARDFFNLLKDYHDGRAEAFNTDLAAYSRTAHRTVAAPAQKASFEVFFNRFDPFTICQVFYVVAFLLVCVYWLSGGRSFKGAALALLALTILVHSAGLVCRIYISGRPPVTNLYSSAVFIGWGAVLLCIGLEVVYRNGFGSAVAAVIGFGPLLIADALAHRDADTMAQLQAVLDTNFWLATHVVCVTLGYAATFLAGILATVYVIGNLITGGVGGSGGMEVEDRKELARMTYGVVCFAMLFSFVGTILGGIWADQSWGRFWGWDPKENGAVLIVLWNALILHARWGGMVREKGLMLLAIGGNILTSWSWFGTNMLGIGLHSYGFMGHAFFWLTTFVVSQILLIAAGAFVKPGDGRAMRGAA